MLFNYKFLYRNYLLLVVIQEVLLSLDEVVCKVIICFV